MPWTREARALQRRAGFARSMLDPRDPPWPAVDDETLATTLADWLAPLRPGDYLTLDVDVAEARVSSSRPETGIVTFKCTARNAAGQALCEMTSPIIVRRASAAAEQ